MQIPKYLYKYEAFSTQSLLNLKSQTIYFGSPLRFNDPYDCALTPNVIAPTDEEVEILRKAYLEDPYLPAKARDEFEKSGTEKLRITLTNAARRAFGEAINDFLKRCGVSCFSERNDDLLMWSHYGGRYKGFCLEFETSSDPFKKINPVRYVPELPAISVAAALNDDFDAVRELFCTKSLAWAYEKEWRAIHKEADTQFCYTAETLTGVYFGPDIDEQAIEIVCLILVGQNEHIKFWRGHRSTTEFKVLFTQFNYTPYLEAKRRGLLE